MLLRIMPSIKGQQSQDAGVVKLVYTTDSKSVAFGRGGSSPPTGTIHRKVAFIAAFRRFGPPKISSIVRFPIQLAQQILWKLVVYSDY